MDAETGVGRLLQCSLYLSLPQPSEVRIALNAPHIPPPSRTPTCDVVLQAILSQIVADEDERHFDMNRVIKDHKRAGKKEHRRSNKPKVCSRSKDSFFYRPVMKFQSLTKLIFFLTPFFSTVPNPTMF